VFTYYLTLCDVINTTTTTLDTALHAQRHVCHTLSASQEFYNPITLHISISISISISRVLLSYYQAFLESDGRVLELLPPGSGESVPHLESLDYGRTRI